MSDDPVVVIANDLADQSATYKLLFQQSLHTLRRQQERLEALEASRDALREEIQRYTARAVEA